MLILLTNDDGINAKGLQVLCKELATIAEIIVVAPDAERSATSQAITVHHPIRVDRQSNDHSNILAWRVGGTPTDCVKIAIESLLDKRPDVVVSGINHGPNLGTDVLYSGTVSAAIEAALHGIPAIAVSLDLLGEAADFEPAARFTKKLIGYFKNNSLPPDTLLNINIPAIREEAFNGVSITKLGTRKYNNTFERRVDPRGRTYYWMGGKVIDSDNDEDTDVIAVKSGKISVTPIHFDLTNYTIMNMLKEWQISY